MKSAFLDSRYLADPEYASECDRVLLVLVEYGAKTQQQIEDRLGGSVSVPLASLRSRGLFPPADK